MRSFHFATVTNTRITAVDGEVRIIVMITIESHGPKGQMVMLEAPFDLLPKVMAILGASEFENLRGSIIRVAFDDEDSSYDIAGPGDDDWLWADLPCQLPESLVGQSALPA